MGEQAGLELLAPGVAPGQQRELQVVQLLVD